MTGAPFAGLQADCDRLVGLLEVAAVCLTSPCAVFAAPGVPSPPAEPQPPTPDGGDR